MLTSEERHRVWDRYDVYDLVELLNLDAADIVEAFDDLVEDNLEIMREIGAYVDQE